EIIDGAGMGVLGPRGVGHMNLGLLPSSRAAWGVAVEARVLGGGGAEGGWVYVHENVGIGREAEMGGDIEEEMGLKVKEEWHVKCEEVFPVKTYAPGVMHCVFDVRVTRK